jgi:hypothetical protein
VKDPFKASSKINDIPVLLGDSSSEETIKIVVESFLVHPDYSNVTFENNMALLQLSEEIKFNELIRPIAVSTQGQTENIDEKLTEEIKILRKFTALFPIIHRLRKNSNFFTNDSR